MFTPLTYRSFGQLRERCFQVQGEVLSMLTSVDFSSTENVDFFDITSKLLGLFLHTV